MKVKQKLKKSYYINKLYFDIRFKFPAILLGDKHMIQKTFYKKMGYKIDWDNPKTLNEKLQILKLSDRKDFNTMAADKYRVKDYFAANFGEEYVIPTLIKFDSWKDVDYSLLPDEPFIIKANTGTSTWQIIRDKSSIDIKDLKSKCRKWTTLNHYYHMQEWQYKNIKPCIIVEKLITDSNGRLPTDYKLHYINGELQFIYCVVDREGDSYRAMFSPQWELLPFQWVSVRNHTLLRKSINAPRPKTLDKMIEFGNIIAKNFKYVRCDFYEVEGKMYFGEITMHHGSGINRFYPPEAEKEYCDKLIL